MSATKLMTAMPMQIVQISMEATCAAAILALQEMAKIVQTWMSAPQILIPVTPMQHARTPKDHLSVSATQVSVALGLAVVTSMNAQCKRITVQ